MADAGENELAAVAAKRRAGFGRYAGKGWIAEDFDAPLPPDFQRYFDGEGDRADEAARR